jgi:endonuclease YncB( thermonuclease family)
MNLNKSMPARRQPRAADAPPDVGTVEWALDPQRVEAARQTPVHDASEFAGAPRLGIFGETMRALVLDVHDGDTLTVGIVVGDKHYRQPLRVMGMDTPEVSLRGGTSALHVAAGKRVRDEVAELLRSYGNQVFITAAATPDKYGRLLAAVTLLDGRHLGSLLVEVGYGLPYGGKTKLEWSDAALQAILDGGQPLQRVAPCAEVVAPEPAPVPRVRRWWQRCVCC